MVFSLIVVVLLLAIAFYQSTQGMFSALIMAVLSMCCATAAVGGYEWVAVNFLAPYWRPDFSYTIALAAMFGVPLIILRLVADKLVLRSCHVHGMFDRIGGGLCGLITGYTVMGMVTLAVQSIPFNGSVLGFERIPRIPLEIERDEPDFTPPPLDAKEKNLWMNPDRFVVGLASIFSSGIFSGERNFGYENPDHIQHVGWINAVPTMVSRYAPPNSISIVRTGTVPMVYTITAATRNTPPTYNDGSQPQSGQEFQMLRVRLLPEARGENPSHIFTLRQFRLVGRPSGTDAMKQYHPIAIQQEDPREVINRHIRYISKRGTNWPVVDEPYEPRPDNNAEVEIVFELPSGFVPAYLEYKHGARAAVKFSENADGDDRATRDAGSDAAQPASESIADTSRTAESAAPQQPKSDDSSRKRSRRSRRDQTVDSSVKGGRVRGVTTLVGASFFGSALPLELKNYRNVKDLSVRRRKIENGHFSANIETQDAGTGRPIREFRIPADKRLLHLNMKRLHARSGIGKILDLAAQTVQNYFVEDGNGNQYPMIGKYAIATVGDQRMIEVQYYPQQAGTIGGLGKFRKIQDTHLKSDYELVLLFLVEPGATITSFSAGGSAQRRDDLRNENLVAPD